MRPDDLTPNQIVAALAAGPADIVLLAALLDVDHIAPQLIDLLYRMTRNGGRLDYDDSGPTRVYQLNDKH